jgi:IS30 family transposase
LSFAAVPAGTSVSSLSQSTKTSSAGKRDGPTITNPYAKKTRSDPSLKFHPGESNDYSPSNVEDDKELDYVPVTNQAVNNIMEGKGTWEEDAMTAMHRKAFYMKAYPAENTNELFAKPQSKSASMKTCRPKTEVDYIKNVIQHWGKGIEIRSMEDGEEKNRLLSFCRRNKVGNKYIHQYCLEEVWAPGDDEPRQVLRRLEAKKGSLDKTPQEGRIVVSREELFDAINEWHQHNGHLGQERTWEYCRTKYWNVTQDHVKHYCMTCYTCMKKNPVTSKIKGSIKPIFSKSFRDRFQFDLVDFRKLRKRDPFGVLMRWVLTIKDHATGITYICALPRKQAHLIAYKLQEIFGFIGYPKIFHTDNGKEFTAKCVLEFLRNLNPNIVSVTGRPRRPRDQGSVENVNKMVKRVLGSVLAERRLAGQNPNWTEVLGSVAAAINSQSGRCKNDVSAYEAVFGDKYDHPMSCTKSEARRCWTLSHRMKVTNDPEFEEFCRENYVIEDGNEDYTDNEGGLKEEDDDDSGYFSDDELPPDETDEVTDEWVLSHLMDDTSSVASAKSSCKSGKKAPPDDAGGETDEEVDCDFVVDDDDVGSMVEDYVEPAQLFSPLLHANSFDMAVSTNMCEATNSFDDGAPVRTNMCKETKSSGDEPPYNRWLELIDKRRAKNKPSLELSEVSRARVNTLFPIVYCTDHHNQFDNDRYWHPCILKKVGRELYEVLDANEDQKSVKEELEFTGEEGLRYLWGLVYKHPSLAFVSAFQKKVLLTTCEGNDTKKVTQAVTTTPCDVQDENGIRFAPSCESKCFIGGERCDHQDLFRVGINQIGQYVVFPSLWWHHGYITNNTPDNIIFTAQLFATPRSDIGSSQRSLRKTSNTKTYTQGTVDSTIVNTLMTDLYLNWDEDYSSTKFPPAKNFFGKVDRDKNRHILHDQIPFVPKIQRLVFAIEDEVGDITVDSV